MSGTAHCQAAARVLKRILKGILAAALLLQSAGATTSIVDRGRYLTSAAGCITCHTEDREGAAEFAGGRALATRFGNFYPPNITPDPETGIGRWSDEQFLAAMWDGRSPQGEQYFPAFPFTSYTGMSRSDALAVKAYLFSLPAVRKTNRPHDLPWYLNTRLAAWAWQRMFFVPARFQPDPRRDASWNRGAYLARHLGHCGECHTPRNVLGAALPDQELAGNPAGPGGKKVPDITADPSKGIGEWSQQDLESFLELGILPDGDFVGAGMGEVVDKVTSRLTAGDRRAIAVYLRSLNAPSKRGPKSGP